MFPKSVGLVGWTLLVGGVACASEPVPKPVTMPTRAQSAEATKPAETAATVADAGVEPPPVGWKCTLDTPHPCIAQCEAGKGRSCFYAGLALDLAKSGTRDPQQVSGFYQKGCDLGDMPSCGNLGLMNEKGSGTPMNIERAMELYQRACDGGEPVHCRNVGRLCEGDAGFPPDRERSATAYQRTMELAMAQCGRSKPESCVVAGYLYRDGKGVPKDPVRERELVERACSFGYRWACNRDDPQSHPRQ